MNLIKNDDDTLDINGLTLGKDEWVRLRYKVNLRTETDDKKIDPNFKEQFYLTNGKDTILNPVSGLTEEYKFGVPAIKLPTVDLTIKKQWEGFDSDDTLPDVAFDIEKSTDGVNWMLVKSEVLSGTTDYLAPYIWEKKISDLPVYDNEGKRYEYRVKEVINEDYIDEYSSSINTDYDDEGNYLFTAVNTAKRAQLIIAKKDKDSNTVFIEGAEFTLYKDSETTEVLDVKETGSDGYLVFSGLKNGTYYIKETKTPDGYKSIADKTIEITVLNEEITANPSSEGIWKITGEDESGPVVLDVYNKKLPPLEIVKVDDEGNPITSDTATFDIYKQSDFTVDELTGKVSINAGAIPVTTVTTDINTGSVIAEYLFEPGKYAVVEKKNPSGYIGLVQPIVIELVYNYSSNSYTWSTEYGNDKVYFGPYGEGELYVINRPLVYPDTGGMGGVLITLGGVLLMGAAYILRKKYKIKVI